MTDQTIEGRVAAELQDLLERVSEFLSQQADAEYHTDSAGPIPNEAMRLQIEVDHMLGFIKPMVRP